MIKVKRFVCNQLQENCYVVSDDTLECAIIDCGAFYKEDQQALADYIADNQLKPVRLISTHGHLDHQFGIATVAEAYGLTTECAAGDSNLIEGLKEQASAIFGMQLDTDFPTKFRYYDDNEKIRFGHHELTVIPTPGHTPGSVTLYCREEGIAFTGDTLFKGSIGRTDFPGGNMFQMISSLRELSQLPDKTIIYPGHGDQTTIGYELAHNPYMDR